MESKAFFFFVAQVLEDKHEASSKRKIMYIAIVKSMQTHFLFL